MGSSTQTYSFLLFYFVSFFTNHKKKEYQDSLFNFGAISGVAGTALSLYIRLTP
jgi:hypothetical protein